MTGAWLWPPSWAPSAEPAALDAVATRCAELGLAVERNRSLAGLTTLGVGGPAALFVAAADRSAVLALLVALAGTSATEVPLFVLGKGSNTLVADGGFPGLVVKLGAGLKWVRREGLEVWAGGGEAMPALAAWTAREGLGGLEFAAGIPATVGGSVRMNAGAHGSDTAAQLRAVDLAVAGSSTVTRVAAVDLGFGYRRSRLPERSVVLAAGWSLQARDPAAVRATLDELRAWRRATQPLRQRNCGSVFTNPPGDSAGRLVEESGLKGRRIGGARVSDKHANFVVVDATAVAADVYRLVASVRATVLERTGVLLEPEVRLLGQFDPA